MKVIHHAHHKRYHVRRWAQRHNKSYNYTVVMKPKKGGPTILYEEGVDLSTIEPRLNIKERVRKPFFTQEGVPVSEREAQPTASTPAPEIKPEQITAALEKKYAKQKKVRERLKKIEQRLTQKIKKKVVMDIAGAPKPEFLEEELRKREMRVEELRKRIAAEQKVTQAAVDKLADLVRRREMAYRQAALETQKKFGPFIPRSELEKLSKMRQQIKAAVPEELRKIPTPQWTVPILSRAQKQMTEEFLRSRPKKLSQMTTAEKYAYYRKVRAASAMPYWSKK